MENGRIIIVMHSDLMHYPPMISLIDIMLELKKKIVIHVKHHQIIVNV